MQDRAIDQDLQENAPCAGQYAERVVLQTLNKYVAAFQKVATPFFQDRIYDVKDIFRRILWHLQPANDWLARWAIDWSWWCGKRRSWTCSPSTFINSSRWSSSTADRRAMWPSWCAVWAMQ